MLPNILIFMSDQHSPIYSSYYSAGAKTPNLEKLCEDGINFSEAYTSCPLCVPSRMSMLLGKLPSKSGIFTNTDAIPERNATFLHSLVAKGYETVLIGRMHFVGTNQRHGFTKRLVGDITPTSWEYPFEKSIEEKGDYAKGFIYPFCLDDNIIGGGNSPVLEYDKEVLNEALNYLSKSYDKPQCIFISTYGPHFPYCGPIDLYNHYKENIKLPDTFYKLPDYLQDNPTLSNKILNNITEETAKNALTAYQAMIEKIDEQVGIARKAFTNFLEKTNQKGIFGYISDHGDQCGDKKMYGKRTFFEGSVKIPMILSGHGIEKGKVIKEPVSIMDLGATLCDFIGAEAPPNQDGLSLCNYLKGIEVESGREVLSEIIYKDSKNPMEQGEDLIGRMVRKGKYKYITYAKHEEYDLLFNIEKDPFELNNIIDKIPEKAIEFKKIAYDEWDIENVYKNYKDHNQSVKLIKAWNKCIRLDNSEKWNPPSSSKELPIVR